jgi:hypothetical protein
MRAKLVMLVAAASLTAVLLVPAAASAKPAPKPVDLTEQVTCSVDCTVEVVRFNDAGGKLNAVLKVTNEVTGETQRVSAPITAQQQGGFCTILEITIPPLDIFILGIRIQTDEIHIVITAQRGTLLGDLLCGLFFPDRGPAAANQLVAPLNEALRQEAATLAPPGG